MIAYKSSKKKQLLDLRKRIIDKYYTNSIPTKWKEVWFFPSYKGIKGFSGTQNIIFLGLNPSFGHFPTKRDKFFYEQLKVSDFQNAHITDLIKRKLTNKESRELEDIPDFKEQLSFMEKEIRIIRPKMIVFLGNKVQILFKKHLKEKCKTQRIPHYAFRWIPEKIFEAKFSKQMAKIKKQYKNAICKA